MRSLYVRTLFATWGVWTLLSKRLVTASIAVALCLGFLGAEGGLYAQPSPTLRGGVRQDVFSSDSSDPVGCFDHVWRDARNALQAYQLALGASWAQGADCATRTRAPELGPCWDSLLQARPLIRQAADLYDRARHAIYQKDAEPLIKQGDTLTRRANELVQQAGKCFQPVFARWQQNGGRYIPADEYRAGSSAPPSGSGGAAPGGVGGLPGEPRIGQYGRDPECGGTNRRYYDEMYGAAGRVMSADEMRQHEIRGEIIRCGACGQDRVICWLKSAATASRTSPRTPTETPIPPMAPGTKPVGPNEGKVCQDVRTPQEGAAAGCRWLGGRNGYDLCANPNWYKLPQCVAGSSEPPSAGPGRPPAQAPRRAGDTTRPTECAALPLPPDVARQLRDLSDRTAKVAGTAARTSAVFLTKMAQAMGARVGMYVRAADDLAAVSPYALPFTLADAARRERIAGRLMAIYAFAADTTDNVRVGYRFMDAHPKVSAWILYRGAAQAVRDIDREVAAIKRDPSRAGPLIGTGAVDALVGGLCAWGGRLAMTSEEAATVGQSVAKLERVAGVLQPAGIQASGAWKRASMVDGEFIDLWHGSRSNATAIERDGFAYRPDTVTYFANSREAAINAIKDAYDPATDTGVFRVRIPQELWNGAAANGHVFERPYAGFQGKLQASVTREYRPNTEAMIELINRFRERQPLP
jgi:hypothetical protein